MDHLCGVIAARGTRMHDMKKSPWIIAASAVLALGAGGGGTAFAMSNEVAVSHYGQQQTVRTFSPTVADLLEAQGIKLKKTDLVTPSLDSAITSQTRVKIVERRPATVTVDGEEQQVLTTGTTVQDALEQAGVDTEGARITPAPETKLDADGTDVQVVTPKTVTFKGSRGQATFHVAALTVDEAMKKVLGDIQDSDTASVPRDSRLQDGATITVKRNRTKDTKTTESIPFETKTEKSGDVLEGETKTKTEGEAGTREKVVRETIVDGKVTAKKVLSEKVTKQPVAKVVLEGTKAKPEPDAPSAGDGAAAPAPKADDSKRSKKATRSSSRDSAPKTDQGGSGTGPTNTCKASHYGLGDGTHGGPTASGERFNRNAMTAAHKSLPLGTRIRVTNKANGQSVVVKINDRGPYISGRCLDLSSGAFDAIGDTGNGVMTVSYQRVG